MGIPTTIERVFSGLTGLLDWLAGQRKRNNDFLSDLQNSINMLVDKNTELLQEVVALRVQNVELKVNQEQMKQEIECLRGENKALRAELTELNQHLAGVKTITRKA